LENTVNFVKRTILVGIALLAMSFGAAAQDRAMTFTLPREARIGKVSLSAGNYRLAVHDGPSTWAMVTSEGRSGAGTIALIATHEYTSSCKSNSVTFTPDGDGFSLTSACFADSDSAVYFFPAKDKREMATRAPDTAALAAAQ
jgi:hypothetical protein